MISIVRLADLLKRTSAICKLGTGRMWLAGSNGLNQLAAYLLGRLEAPLSAAIV
jgi:hypothetical protein